MSHYEQVGWFWAGWWSTISNQKNDSLHKPSKSTILTLTIVFHFFFYLHLSTIYLIRMYGWIQGENIKEFGISESIFFFLSLYLTILAILDLCGGEFNWLCLTSTLSGTTLYTQCIFHNNDLFHKEMMQISFAANNCRVTLILSFGNKHLDFNLRSQFFTGLAYYYFKIGFIMVMQLIIYCKGIFR